MSLIRPSDPAFRVCPVDRATLERLQEVAEQRGWPTRWSSVGALRRQVADGPVLLQTFLRQRTGTGHPVVRCLALFRAAGGEAADEHRAGGVATIDVDPSQLEALARVDHDPDTRAAFAQVVALATGGIAAVSKE